MKFNRKIIVVFVIFLVMSLNVDVSISDTKSNFIIHSNSVSNTWTIMVYLCGDNNLEKWAVKALNDMERGFIEDYGFSIIVLIDLSDEYNDSKEEWSTTRYYEVQHDESKNIGSILLQDLGEKNLGGHSVLNSFIDFCFDNYSAENYMLCLWDHGGGLDGICYDHNPGFENNIVTNLEINIIESAMKLAEKDFSERIDIVTLLGCQMGFIDVAYEFREVTNYCIFSETFGYSEGIDWELLITQLVNNQFMEPIILVWNIVESYRKTDVNIRKKTTCSAINISQISNLDFINNFALNLTETLDNDCFQVLNQILDNTLFFKHEGMDIIHFLENILEDDFLQQNFLNLTISARLLLHQLKKAVLWNYQDESFEGAANGLKVFFPYPYYYIYDSTSYDSRSDFSRYSKWNEFYQKFHFMNSDNDSLNDWFEIKYGFNHTSLDSDSNGILDNLEDNDEDGLTNFKEYQYGANPFNSDSDNDKINDYKEVNKFYTKPFTKDSDYDGFSDWSETHFFFTKANNIHDSPNIGWYITGAIIGVVVSTIIVLIINKIITKRKEKKIERLTNYYNTKYNQILF